MDDLLESTRAPDTAPAPTDGDGWEWAIVEVFGHRRHFGRTREEEKFGAKMLRVDVPVNGDPTANGWQSIYYGGGALFSYTLTDEATVLSHNKPWAPPSRVSLPAPGDPIDAEHDEGDDEDDDEDDRGDVDD